MTRICRLLVLPLLFLLAPRQLPAEPADKPQFVVQMQPPAKVIRTLKQFARKYSAPQLGEQAEARTTEEIEDSLNKVMGKDWRKAIDENKPIVAYGSLNEKGDDLSLVVLLPVTSAEAARAQLKARGHTIEAGTDDCEKITVPGQKRDVFFRFAHGCLCASLGSSQPLTPDRLLAPEALLDAQEKAPLAMHLHLDRLPRSFTDSFLASFREGYQRGFQQTAPGALPDPVNKAVGQLRKRIERWADAIVKEGKDAVIRVDLDPRTGELRTGLKLTPRQDTKLVKMLTELRSGPSLGAALAGDKRLACVHARLQLPEEIGSMLLAALRHKVKQAGEKSDDDKASAAHSNLVEALEPTARESVLDTSLVLQGPGKKKRYTALFGLQLADGLAVEKAARKVIGFLPANHPLGLLRMDTDTIGDVKVHRYPLGEMLPQPARTLLGTGTAVIAFRKDGLLVAYGEEADELLAQALAVPLKKAQPLVLQAEGDPRGAADMLAPLDPNSAQQLRSFAGLFEDRLHVVELSLVGGDSLEVRAGVNLILLPRAAAKQPAPRKPGGR